MRINLTLNTTPEEAEAFFVDCQLNRRSKIYVGMTPLELIYAQLESQMRQEINLRKEGGLVCQ